ncbi:MAG: InlB B-repeat-containing protein [Clostridiales bacterium]|nr:InlB B-repeat-containing protein [Clostridiales bacterium]
MKKRLLSIILVTVLLFSCCCVMLAGCIKPDDEKTKYTVSFDVGSAARAAGVRTPESQQVEEGGTAVQPTIDAWSGHTLTGWYKGTKAWNFSTDTVNSDITLTAEWEVAVDSEKAQQYEQNLTWGEKGHLYVHYLRGAHLENEEGTVNTATAPNYSTQIKSDAYGDWGLWVWPPNGDGRSFYPSKIDASGAVYDIDLTATYNDAGWDSENKKPSGKEVNYKDIDRIGIQIYSQDSRVNGSGFWVNDGGDVWITLATAIRDKGDYHWFVTQGSVGNGSPVFANTVVDDPYAGLEPGSATSKSDVVSNMGNTDLYKQQPVAEGWEDNGVGYQIFIASFADSDGDGMGDLRGVIQKLDYLKDLGVDTLWLTPFQTSNSYHGYDIMDYFTVDPRFGTLDDYRELIYKAHQKGMKVLLDFVLNHTSSSNPWFIKSQNLVKETITLPDGTKKEIDYRNFYNWQNDDYVNKLDSQAKAQWYKDSNGYYFYSSFSSSMPELNFDYQATRDAILEVALYWMSFGLDGFRLDAVKHIYMKNENPNHSDWVVSDGAYSFDMNKDAHFFMEFNAKLKATYPNALLVGENFNGNPAYLAGLYGGMDSQFNFNWYYDVTTNITSLADERVSADAILNTYAKAQNEFAQYRTDYIDGIFTSNHDVQRARDRLYPSGMVPRTAYPGDGADWLHSENLAKMYAALCLTMPGITWIYNGDELGMFGTSTSNAGGVIGHEDRWFRQPVKWSKNLADSTYNCNYPMGFQGYYIEWDVLNAKLDGVVEQSNDSSSILNLYKDIIAIRKANPAIIRGKVESHSNNTVICYTLKDDNNEILVYINATYKQQIAAYTPKGTLLYGHAVNTGASISVSSGGAIPAMSIAIYKVK